MTDRQQQTSAEEFVEEARALRDAGRVKDSILLYRQAILAAKDCFDAYFEWGCIAYERGNYKKAWQLFDMAVYLNPAHAPARSKLGAVFAATGRYGQARTAFEKALALDDTLMPAYYNLALLLLDTFQDYWAVEDVARQGLAKDKDYGLLYTVLGKALHMQGRTEEAIEAFEKAIRLMPEAEAENLCNLGTLYTDRADLKKAQTLLQQAIARAPDYIESHYKLSRIHKYRQDDPHIKEMEALLAKAPKQSEDAARLNFALAKAHDDIGDYDAAFAYFAQGNWLVRSGLQFRAKATQASFERIKDVFSGDFLSKALPPPKEQDFTPIFIVGMPRSGTTLTEQILFSHPMVAAGGETPYLDQVQRAGQFNRFGDYGHDIMNFPDEKLQEMRDGYIEKIKRHAPDARIITDKLPTNFRFIGLIRLLFPQAKVIHCRRDPMDTCFSIFKCMFSGFFPFAYDLKELGQYYRLYEDMMAFWHEKLPGFIYDLQYEELISDQEAVTRDLLACCDLPWDPACLAFHEKQRTIMTASMLQVKKPLYKDAVGKWKKYEKHLRLLEKELS